MASMTLKQCYLIQNQLIEDFKVCTDLEVKAKLALAWDKIVTKQRVLRGVPSLAAVKLEPLRAKASSTQVLRIPEHVIDVEPSSELTSVTPPVTVPGDDSTGPERKG